MKGTVFINFDLEMYVPSISRNNNNWHMDGNAAMKDHFLLGGTFSHQNPNKANFNDLSKYNSFWIWDKTSFDIKNPKIAEKEILSDIYNYISELYKKTQQEEDRDRPALICFIGVGINRFDLNVLYIRSVLYNIAPQEELFNLYGSARRLDFSEVGVPFLKIERNYFQIFPLSNSKIVEVLNVKSGFDKPSGKAVWDQYENQKFKEIENRNTNEVILNYKIYSKIRSKVTFRKPKRSV